jgi:hypothetical protein
MYAQKLHGFKLETIIALLSEFPQGRLRLPTLTNCRNLQISGWITDMFLLPGQDNKNNTSRPES